MKLIPKIILTTDLADGRITITLCKIGPIWSVNRCEWNEWEYQKFFDTEKEARKKFNNILENPSLDYWNY